MLAQLIKDLLHLERRRDGLDEHGRAGGSHWNVQELLRAKENVIPQPRLKMVLQLGQVEVRAVPTIELPSRSIGITARASDTSE